MRFGLPEWLEVINGAWAAAAASLIHEWIAIGFYYMPVRKWRGALTLGMRVALAIGTISLGVLITRVMMWVWRVIYGGGMFANWQLGVLVLGAVVGLVGFICAIREYSRTLFGDWVWVLSTAAIVLVAFLTALPHLVR